MTRFDTAYFKRFYFNPATRVTTGTEMRSRATLIAAILAQVQVPVRRILDAGCGIGLMRPAFLTVLPKATYTGLETSDYLCQRYGWQRGSVAGFATAKPFDLLVCYDVLQYLTDREAAVAMVNFSNLTRAALYFSALTRADWRDNCDRTLTDANVRLRTANWYRQRLRKEFMPLGFGVWVRRTLTVIRWELEA